MIVNLYVDHLMANSPTSAEEVWNATREHPKLFSDAADRIGLTPAEYREFRNNLLDGKAVYVKLPRRLDAMSGARHGSVYAVKNAMMNKTIMGWRVDLADGNVVYVPQICGNISLLRHAAIAHVQRKRHPYVAHARHVPYTPAIAHVPETPVVVTPPEEVPAETAPTVAQAIPAAATHGSPFFFFIPAAVAGLVAGLSHGSTPAPPCNHGSNASNVCQK
jgi:putative component of toxin-antitoxin plasmid stabilization module